MPRPALMDLAICTHAHAHSACVCACVRRDLAAIQILCLLCLHSFVVPPKQKFSLWRNEVVCDRGLLFLCVCVRARVHPRNPTPLWKCL